MFGNNADQVLGQLTVTLLFQLTRARVYECANGGGLTSTSPLFFAGIIQASDLSLCLLLPLSHHALASSDAFIMWHFMALCPLACEAFDFYAVGKHRDADLLSADECLESRFL